MSDIVINSQLWAPPPHARERARAIRKALLAKTPLAAAVVGAGKSGVAAAELLLERGATVTLLDDKSPDELAKSPKTAALLARVKLAKLSAEALERAEVVILSPGLSRSRPELASAIVRGIVFGEIELASWFVSAPLVGITGTNGKSTTTALTGHVLEAAGLRTFAGGNLGDPLANLVLSGRAVDVAVVELSSFQCESFVDASFEVASWLNLTPDHAERYADLSSYAGAKARLLERRTATGTAVLNAADPWCLEAAKAYGGRVRWFWADHEDGLGAGRELAREGGTGIVSMDEAVRTIAGKEEVYRLSNPALPGLHNRANMCAAIEHARAVGAAPADVERGLLSFRGLPHRIELVGTVDGVHYYNDSKATNVDSTLIALRALHAPKILIAGGKDKGAPWTPLRDAAGPYGVVAVLAIGKASPIVMEAFTGAVPIVEELKTLDAALVRARALAKPGDAVLLSPACASYDQFDNYEHRGDVFRSLVQGMGRVA